MMSPLRGLRSDQLSGLVLFALGVFVAWYNRDYPLGSLQEPGPGYTPLLIAIFLAAMGLLIALTGGSSTRFAEMRWPEGRRAAVILLACAVATYALEPLGYIVTIAALLFFFVGVLERRGIVATTLMALGFSVISYYLIGVILHVPLPRGPWGW